jgi:methylation protein EvaC
LVSVIDRRLALGRALIADSFDSSRRRAAKEFADFIADTVDPPRGGFVIEIGCNDGALLDIFDDKGYRVQGLEPAINVAKYPIAKEYPTHVGLLLPSIAERIIDQRSLADVVIARDSFAETDNPAAFAMAARTLLKPGGVFVFEVPAIHEIRRLKTLAGISHQACHYFAARALARFLEACDMDLNYLSYSDQYQARLRGVARKSEYSTEPDLSVPVTIAGETRAEPLDKEALEALARDITADARALADQFRADVKNGKRVAALGLAADGVTYLHIANLDSDIISSVHTPFVDLHGLMVPGTTIPICDDEDLLVDPPDHLIVLGRHFAGAEPAICDVVRGHGGQTTWLFPKVYATT